MLKSEGRFSQIRVMGLYKLSFPLCTALPREPPLRGTQTRTGLQLQLYSPWKLKLKHCPCVTATSDSHYKHVRPRWAPTSHRLSSISNSTELASLVASWPGALFAAYMWWQVPRGTPRHTWGHQPNLRPPANRGLMEEDEQMSRGWAED